MSNNGEKIHDILDTLRAIAKGVDGDHVSIESFSTGLGRRGYGLLLFALNLPNLIPLPLPIISMILGLPLAFVGLLLMLGIPRPWLPKALLRRGVKKSDMLRFCDRVEERFGWVHKLVRPRLTYLLSPGFVRLIGAAIFGMAFVMVLPIPLGNLVLAIPIALLALGLVEKDGVFIIAGLVMGALGILFNFIIGLSVLMGIFMAIGHMFGA